MVKKVLKALARKEYLFGSLLRIPLVLRLKKFNLMQSIYPNHTPKTQTLRNEAMLERILLNEHLIKR